MGGTYARDARGNAADARRKQSPRRIRTSYVTDFGYDRLGGALDQIKALPGVATSNAAKNNHIYRIEENVLMYFGPRSGENIEKVAAIIHQK